MHLILKDGTQLNHLGATSVSKYIQGATRDTLTFEFNSSYSVDELRAFFNGANCETIIIVTDDLVERIVELEDGTTEVVNEVVQTNNYWDGYVIRAEVAEKIKEIEPATGTTPAVTETRVFVTMAQRTYAETQMAILQNQNDLLAECILELSSELYA